MHMMKNTSRFHFWIYIKEITSTFSKKLVLQGIPDKWFCKLSCMKMHFPYINFAAKLTKHMTASVKIGIFQKYSTPFQCHYEQNQFEKWHIILNKNQISSVNKDCHWVWDEYLLGPPCSKMNNITFVDLYRYLCSSSQNV